MSARYWLVNSGTTAQPWVGQLIRRYSEWNAAHGDVQGFSRRPSISAGDILIHRAIGSEGDRLVALAVVIGTPEDQGHGQWPWRLPRRLTFVCATDDVAPRADDLGIEAYQMRTYKEIGPAIGKRAAEAIAAVGQWWQ